MIKVGAVIRTVNPDDRTAKPGRPAIVVFVERPVVGLCFGTGTHREHYPHKCVSAGDRLGRRLGLNKDTHFYASETVFMDVDDLPPPERLHSAPALFVGEIQDCEPRMADLTAAGVKRVLAERAVRQPPMP